jgi:hypothetical protein
MQLTCLPFYAYTFFPQVIDEMKGKDLEAIIAEGTGKFAKVCISMHTCFKYYTYTDGTQSTGHVCSPRGGWHWLHNNFFF